MIVRGIQSQNRSFSVGNQDKALFQIIFRRKDIVSRKFNNVSTNEERLEMVNGEQR